MVVRGFGTLAYAVHEPEKCSDIYAASVVIDSHAGKTLQTSNSLHFFRKRSQVIYEARAVPKSALCVPRMNNLSYAFGLGDKNW